MPPEHLSSWFFIYGPPGSGKSALGKRLAEELKLPFFDLDEMIETQAGASIPDIFEMEGEAGFRQRESMALIDLLEGMSRRNNQEKIVALGGGTLLSEENRRRIVATGPVLCLHAPVDALVNRLEASNIQRPLLDGEAKELLNHLLEQREAHYRSFPRQLDTGLYTLDETVWQIQIHSGMFRVSGMGSDYDVRVADGSLNGLGQSLRDRGMKGPIAIVGDEIVARYYQERVIQTLESAGFLTKFITIPAGERFKTLETIQLLWNGFLVAGLERYSTVVALGGGVVSDLSGFAAATYHRGIPWVVAPTSLLGMVDASLGGKTGADLPQGKNLIGAFHPPGLVVADPTTLTTLPEFELRNGLSEAVKHGIIGDPSLFGFLGELKMSDIRSRVSPKSTYKSSLDQVQPNEKLSEIVRRGVAVKAAVIQADPFERDQRLSLNLGHTLGHALEAVSGYQIRHGEAVAIGMVAAARLSWRLGLAEYDLPRTISRVLQHLGLPTEIPQGIDHRRLLVSMNVDKKRAGGKPHLVLPVDIGRVKWGVEIENLEMLING